MRDWIKPELVVEEFELSQHVALGCAPDKLQPRASSANYTVTGHKVNEKGIVSDWPDDKNDILDGYEVSAVVKEYAERVNQGHIGEAEYTVNGRTYNYMQSKTYDSWPFSS